MDLLPVTRVLAMAEVDQVASSSCSSAPDAPRISRLHDVFFFILDISSTVRDVDKLICTTRGSRQLCVEQLSLLVPCAMDFF